MKLIINAYIQIQKPAHEVFEAIVDPAKMSNYFIRSSTGRMEEGAILTWKFPEFDAQFKIRVGIIRRDEYVSFYWPNTLGQDMFVEMTLKPGANNSTVITVTEKEMDNDEEGIKWFGGNTYGWANFLACLKAYLEYGINLRKGAFDFPKAEPK
jgi:uncharacterized protein YndB with AHSA1/START domain